jgi:hypothetical protein
MMEFNPMKKILLVALTGLTLIAPLAMARDDVADFSIADALSLEKAKTKLGTKVAFYFGDQAYGEPEQNFGVFQTNKKTNAFGKSDLTACQWVFLSAMISLRDRALTEGGNAVVDIKSNYKNNETSSTETFQCGAGGVIAGVALKGRVVTLN